MADDTSYSPAKALALYLAAHEKRIAQSIALSPPITQPKEETE